ncbi:hypothetical protein SAMN06265348_110181 [Pedobacter westerhofensis]|uniref:Uncharacterized protein n=1 Tax=Pedobacter westerhofensis TaxID=425512 RepID=A0A521F7I0_9SPHI|nr:hypothetical protein [Pedobacter westerhofensis]SMO91480.1 hypothetical protein SAMN06265348_110181 [Pedobacter westerhofensis]
MKERIGMLIWKEMNRQGLTHGKFVETLRARNVFLKDFFKFDVIDPYSLIQISEVLKVNFFQFYEPEDLTTSLRIHDKDNNKISLLKDVVKRQDKLLLTQQRMIREQDDLIKKLKEIYHD